MGMKTGAYGMRVYSLLARALLDFDLPDGITISGAKWSPEGDQIAFLAHLPDRTEVWVADVNSGDATSLANADGATETIVRRRAVARERLAPRRAGDRSTSKSTSASSRARSCESVVVPKPLK